MNKKTFSVNNINYTIMKGKTVSEESGQEEDVMIVLHKIGCCSGVFQNLVKNWDYDSLHLNRDFRQVCDHPEDWFSVNGTESLENGQRLKEWIRENYMNWI